LVPAAYYADLIAARARFHSRGEKWSDTEGSPELTRDLESLIAIYAVVKNDLQNVMYFM
jgi:hypothetical protein